MDEEGCCCGCALGLLVGILLCHPHSHAETLEQKTEQTVSAQTDEKDSFLVRQVKNYQVNISPKLRERLKTDSLCKFEPSCSEYSLQSLEKYGSFKGSLMTTKRLMKCNPFSKGGYDSVE